jgi:hypothetical protein
MSLKNKPIYKVFVEKPNKKAFNSLIIKQNSKVEKINNNGLNSLKNKQSLLDLFNKSTAGVIKALWIKEYRKGFKTHEIAEAHGVSTRTVWKTIKKAFNNKKLGRHYWKRRIPAFWRLKGVKIKRIKTLQFFFYKLLEAIQNGDFLDLDNILSEKPV